MASKRMVVRDALVAALSVASVGSTTKPTGLVVVQDKTRASEAEDGLPDMNVTFQGNDPPDYSATLQAEYTGHFWVDYRAVFEDGDDPEDALDPLYVWAVKAIMADVTLGGAAAEIDEGDSVMQIEEQLDGVVSGSTEFLVRYRSAYNDPEITG